jgi:plastocyanin
MTFRGALGGAIALMLLGCGTVKSPTAPVGAQPVVQVSSFMFTPRELTIRAGQTVTWTNQDGFHNVTADDGTFHCAAGCDDTGGNGAPSSAAWSFTRTFNSPGVVPYHCAVHGGPGGQGMSGTITVTSASSH